MITQEDARNIARAYLKSEMPDLDLVITCVDEFRIGWGIGYETRKCLEGDWEEGILGPGPLLILKEGGSVLMLATWQPMEDMVRDYTAFLEGRAAEDAPPLVLVPPSEEASARIDQGPPPSPSIQKTVPEVVERIKAFVRDAASRDEHEGEEVTVVGWFLAEEIAGVAKLTSSAFQLVIYDDLALAASLHEGLVPDTRTWYLVTGRLCSMGFEGIFAGIEIHDIQGEGPE